ncbi:protein S100-A13-like [Pelobates fuscus]|uniref:protein S100-A13-like n=1 Tax=Pelobates fuscus TaxID=191477 RepID=UPI002FE46A1B
MAASQTEVEKAIFTIIQCFHVHAQAEGKRDSLSMAEFNKLVAKEFQRQMKGVSIEEKMKELDINKDNELTFTEYWKLVGDIAKDLKSEVKGKKS